MSEFFEPPPPLPPEEEEEEDYAPKPWHGPPSNVLGGYIPLELRLARTGDVVVFVRGLVAYENGFEFQVQLRIRNWELSESLGNAFHGFPLMGGPRIDETTSEIPPEKFRFGIQFPDGAKATNTEHRYFGLEEDEEPTPPTLWERGGGGGGEQWKQGSWVWPLPPPQPFDFVCEWPVAEIPLTRVKVDGSAVVDASRRAEVLWPLEREGRRIRRSMSGWSTVGIVKTEPADDEGKED